MQSKRGKAKNVKANAKNQRSAGAQRKQSKPTAQKRRNALGSNASGRVSQSLAAPLASGIVMSKFFGLRFDRAPSHDEFPEGGLRIAGCLPLSTGVLVQDTVLFGLAGAGNGLASFAINPCSAAVTGTTDALVANTSPLAVFAQYFRKFRFRKVAVEYTSEVSPGVVTAAAGAGLLVQIAHEPDIVTAEQASGTYTMDTSVVTGNCTRFSAWANSVRCPVISENRASPSDQLFFCSTAGDQQAATGDAALRQTNQGAITATCSAVNPTADLTIAKVLVEFIVDLYGFTNIVTGLLPSGRRRAKPVLSLQAERGDEKKASCEPEYVELVKLDGSDRLRIRTEIVDFPAQTPAKTQSLKGRS